MSRPGAILVLTGLCSLLGCGEHVKLVCGGECYSGPTGTRGVGICAAGEYVCSATVAGGGTCVGEVLPAEEVCNAVDDDCDGVIDNVRSLPDVSPCAELFGLCHSQRAAVCVDGAWVCPFRPKTETCNFLDDDCDGIVDNISPTLCYSAQDISVSVRYPCRPGIVRCSTRLEGAARTICAGEVTPKPDLCDGVDNDCNGVVDDGPGSRIVPIDVIVALDRSGSMGLYRDAIRQALELLRDSNLDIAFWVWDIPARDWPPGSPPRGEPNRTCHGVTPTPPVAACQEPELSQTITLISTPGDYGALEPTLDVLFDLLQPGAVQWRPGSDRYILLFADEDAQSTQNRTAADVEAALRASPELVTVVIYTAPSSRGYPGGDPLAPASTYVIRKELLYPADDLRDDIVPVVSSRCE